MDTGKTVLAVAGGVVLGGLALCGIGAWLVTPHGLGKPEPPRISRGDDARSLFETLIKDQTERGDAFARYVVTEGSTTPVAVPDGCDGAMFLLRDGGKGVLHPTDGYADVILEADLPKSKPRIGFIELPPSWGRSLRVTLKGGGAADLAFVVYDKRP